MKRKKKEFWNQYVRFYEPWTHRLTIQKLCVNSSFKTKERQKKEEKIFQLSQRRNWSTANWMQFFVCVCCPASYGVDKISIFCTKKKRRKKNCPLTAFEMKRRKESVGDFWSQNRCFSHAHKMKKKKNEQNMTNEHAHFSVLRITISHYTNWRKKTFFLPLANLHLRSRYISYLYSRSMQSSTQTHTHTHSTKIMLHFIIVESVFGYKLCLFV